MIFFRSSTSFTHSLTQSCETKPQRRRDKQRSTSHPPPAAPPAPTPPEPAPSPPASPQAHFANPARHARSSSNASRTLFRTSRAGHQMQPASGDTTDKLDTLPTGQDRRSHRQQPV